ncbi:MAG: hypothetical protein Q6359_10160 [Candidatus Brocadiales bacterium]|nr:hypothetical protein [Candidatus Brocadiales bacterium]
MKKLLLSIGILTFLINQGCYTMPMMPYTHGTGHRHAEDAPCKCGCAETADKCNCEKEGNKCTP